MGSPIGLKEISSHLRRVRSSFPFEITGPWLNLVGRADLVAAGRGISRIFPEVLDVYVDTGWTSAHEPDKYLAQSALVRAFGWLERTDEAVSDRSLPELRLPDQLIPVVAFAQYALRLGQALKPGSQQTRFEAARALMAATVRQTLLDHGVRHPVIDRLIEDNADLLRGRFRGEPLQLIDALFRAHMSNPVSPYEINTPQVAKANALRSLATDLGAPSSSADAVIAAVEAARKAHEGFPVGRVALGAAAAALFVAAPYLVVAAAPAGAAGGAAIVGGLAALGPGGMLGGLARRRRRRRRGRRSRDRCTHCRKPSDRRRGGRVPAGSRAGMLEPGTHRTRHPGVVHADDNGIPARKRARKTQPARRSQERHA